MGYQTVNHICGHTSTPQMYGKHTERERKAQWMGQDVCPYCAAKAAAEAAKKQHEINAPQGLADLKGSDKQIAWALGIRAKAMADIETAMATVPETARTGAQWDLANTAIDRLKNQSSAAWWIDRRNRSGRDILTGVATAIKDREGK